MVKIPLPFVFILAGLINMEPEKFLVESVVAQLNLNAEVKITNVLQHVGLLFVLMSVLSIEVLAKEKSFVHIIESDQNLLIHLQVGVVSMAMTSPLHKVTGETITIFIKARIRVTVNFATELAEIEVTWKSEAKSVQYFRA